MKRNHAFKLSLTLTIILVAAAIVFTGCKGIQPVPVTLFIDGNYCVLNKQLEYREGVTTNVVIVPAGFVTDFASIPRAFYSVYRPTGRYQWAAIVHDYLYWEQVTTREEADRLLLHAMEESGVSKMDRIIIYKAVRIDGSSAWNKNKNEKASGLPRIVPPQLITNIPPNITWDEYRTFLYDQGVRP